MTPRSKVLLVSTLVASIGAAGLATASFAGKGHYGGPGYGGMHGKGHMSFLAVLDTDGDGKLTQAEITEEMQERLVTFDGDGDGQLSLDEFELLWLDFHRTRMVDRFQHLDEDGDGIVTEAEYMAPMANIVERMDRDGDGMLSPSDRRHHKKHKYHDDHDDDQDDH